MKWAKPGNFLAALAASFITLLGAGSIFAEPVGPMVLEKPDRTSAKPALRLGASFHVWQTLSFSGSVRVDEYKTKGDDLSLVGDLGMDSWTEADAEINYRITERNLIRLVYTRFFYAGSAILPTDVNFNGVTLLRERTVDVSHTDHYRISLILEHMFRDPVGDARVTLLTGILYDSMSFHVDGKKSPLSRRSEDSENFRKQALPLPMIGIRVEEQFIPSYDSFFEVYGLWLPPVATPFDEGGTITESQSVLEVSLGLKRKLGPALLSAAYRYKHFEIKEVSDEDLNHLQIFGSGVELGIEWRF
jgi:hypothetical protein